MKKQFVMLLMSVFCLVGCNNGPVSVSDTSDTQTTSETSEPTSERGIPTFSKNEYSYDRNALGDLEIPVELNGVNIFATYFDDYLISRKEAYYNETLKTLVIAEDFMKTVQKGIYNLKVIFDEEIDPANLTITIMNSVTTTFDITQKSYKFGKTGDLYYECDFSIASVTSLMKGDVVIPTEYYEFDGTYFILKSGLLDRCFGTPQFTLLLSNNDIYTFSVETDIMFFTDYDITTIHSTIESIHGANPLYQYAASDSVMIIDATEFGMSGNALKYIPNNVEVELDCHSIMTLADVTTSMTWYKVGYTAAKTYAISFDYQTIGSSDVSGQQFVFATTPVWGAPFTYSQKLLMGPENDGKVHNFSVILTGTQIQAGTFIYAKWIGGSGYLLLDNFRVLEIEDDFVVNSVESYTIDSGDYTVNLNSNGWLYTIEIDGVAVPSAICDETLLTIPAAFMDTLAVGTHTLTFVTPIGKFSYTFVVKEYGVCTLNETTKSFTSTSETVKYAGEFINCSILSVKKFGQNQYDASHQDGIDVPVANFALEADGLVIKPAALDNLYGTTKFEFQISTGEVLTVYLTSVKTKFFTNFNEVDVWCWSATSGAYNMSICQDSGMTSATVIDGRKALVYEPKNATLPHSSSPGTHQNGILTFKRDIPEVAGTMWEPLTLDVNTTYKFTLQYTITGANENTKLIFYRWLTSGAKDKSNIINPSATTWEYTCLGGEFVGFYLYCAYTATSDVTNYKVTITSFKVEAV